MAEAVRKRCSKCKSLLSLERFAKDKKGRHGRRAECRKCEAMRRRKHRLTHRSEHDIERIATRNALLALMHRYQREYLDLVDHERWKLQVLRNGTRSDKGQKWVQAG